MANQKVYLSQKEAKKMLCAVGFTGAAACEEVERMAKKTFGKREKVKAADVRRLIDREAAPTPPPVRTVRPIKFTPEVIAYGRF